MYPRFTKQVNQTGDGFDFVAAHFACEADRYCDDNPGGFVNFGSAQNLLSGPDLAERLETLSLGMSDFAYQSFQGDQATRSAVAVYLSGQHHPHSETSTSIDADDIVVGNGLISLLEALCIATLDEGDSVLIPTPVFPGLVSAMSTRVQSRVVFAPACKHDHFRITVDGISMALSRAAHDGHRIKAILLSSPGNPVGQVFHHDELREIAEVAAAFDCHLIVDEVYAGSCFGEPSFRSATQLDGDHVFVLGGLSKDHGLAGYAAGWLHGTNPVVMKAVRAQAHFYRLPSPIGRVIQSVLDPDWNLDYLDRHRDRLRKAYDESIAALDGIGVQTIRSEAGLFVWMDLRAWIDQPGVGGELELYRHLLEKHRVHISPSVGFHHPTTGMFRLCFTVDDRSRREGLRRLADGLSELGRRESCSIGNAEDSFEISWY